MSLVRMAMLAGGLTMLTGAAQADGLCGMAPKLLACFHPTAQYTTCESTTSTPTLERGVIHFTGGLHKQAYLMDIQLEYRAPNDTQSHRMAKATLLQDDAPMAPAQCSILSWQRMD